MTKARKMCAGCRDCTAELFLRAAGNVFRKYRDSASCQHSVQFPPALRYSFSIRTHAFKLLEGKAPAVVVWMNGGQGANSWRETRISGGLQVQPAPVRGCWRNLVYNADQTQETAPAVAPVRLRLAGCRTRDFCRAAFCLQQRAGSDFTRPAFQSTSIAERRDAVRHLPPVWNQHTDVQMPGMP